MRSSSARACTGSAGRWSAGLSDESAIALYERATLLHGEGRFDAALAALRDAIRRAEEDEDGHEPSWMYWVRYREGLYLYKLGRTAEALVALARRSSSVARPRMS